MTKRLASNVLKVAVVAYSAPPFGFGGVASAHYNLFLGLRDAGLDAKLFTFGEFAHKGNKIIIRNGTPGWLSKVLRKLNGLIFGLVSPGQQAYQIFDIANSQWGAWKMGRAINRFFPDVIILSDHGAPGFVLKKPKACKVVLVSHHNPARFRNLKTIPKSSKTDVDLAIRIEQSVLAKVDAIICPSYYMKKWFVKTYKFSGPLVVIGNLIASNILASIQADDPRSKIFLKKNDPLLYMPSVGSLLKGSEYFLRIATTISTLRPDKVVGFYVPGDISDELVRKARLLKLHLYAPGRLSYRRHIANMKSCDLGVSPSLMENYSMALLEAVTCGIPMLAYKVGGNSEIIKNGENGFLVKSKDFQALSTKASLLLNRARLRAIKRKTVLYSGKQFSPKRTLRAYMKLIESL